MVFVYTGALGLQTGTEATAAQLMVGPAAAPFSAGRGPWLNVCNTARERGAASLADARNGCMLAAMQRGNSNEASGGTADYLGSMMPRLQRLKLPCKLVAAAAAPARLRPWLALRSPDLPCLQTAPMCWTSRPRPLWPM